MIATMLEATLWLAVAATSVTVCASWGVAQALAKMKESARQGFMLMRPHHYCQRPGQLWQPTSCHK